MADRQKMDEYPGEVTSEMNVYDPGEAVDTPQPQDTDDSRSPGFETSDVDDELPVDFWTSGPLLDEDVNEPTEEPQEVQAETPDVHAGPEDVKPAEPAAPQQQTTSELTPEELVQLKMIRDTIVSDPELYNLVVQHAAAKAGALPHEPQQKQEEPQQQVKPPVDMSDIPRPANFDPAEALDPTTESGKWYMAQQARRFAEMFSPVLEKVESRINELDQKLQQERERIEAEKQYEQFRRSFEQFLANHPEASQYQEQFIQFINNPGVLDFEDAWELFVKKTGLAAKGSARAAVEQSQARVPQAPPVAEVGGGGQRPKNPGDILERILTGSDMSYEA